MGTLRVYNGLMFYACSIFFKTMQVRILVAPISSTSCSNKMRAVLKKRWTSLLIDDDFCSVKFLHQMILTQYKFNDPSWSYRALKPY